MHRGGQQPLDDGSFIAPLHGASIDGCRFLLGRSVDAETLARAAREAEASGVGVHDVLIAHGWISRGDYASALAKLVDDRNRGHPPPAAVTATIEATAGAPSQMLAAAQTARSLGQIPLLVDRDAAEWLESPETMWERLDEAIRGLGRRMPGLSAARPPETWQIVSLFVAIGLIAGGLMVLPDVTLAALIALATTPFVAVVGLRVLSLAIVLQRRPGDEHEAAPLLPDAALPVYSILVPLYDEAEVLPDLVAALTAIDYPAAKLDILLVLEESDQATISAARALDLPGSYRIVIVPDAEPRTKPKALNYALGLARGAYVVVYDAEDAPEPDQLRRAAATFAAGPPELACLQARLNIYNNAENWLTRQFTLEYSALFDALLPGLVRLGLPVPLGGTSNHFPRPVLERIGGWDAFNVTEDADLGIRLARLGGKVHILWSTTYEEAPTTLRVWGRQRTRWMKGFMQTWLVHMRSPGRLWRELGAAGFIGFQALLGGLLLSSLIHPIFVLVAAFDLAEHRFLGLPDSLAGRLLYAMAAFNLLAGYLSGMALAGLAVARRGIGWLALGTLLMPLYWLMISLAAYRAVWKLVREPFQWEKTPHRAGRRGPPRPPAT